MKDKIETDKIWIDVETLAILKNITKRAVRLSLNKNKYEYIIENVKGGKTYKIKLSSIEENYQKKYIQEMYIKDNYINSELIELNNFIIKQEKIITQQQKEFALAKYDLIKCWQKFKKDIKSNKLQNNKPSKYSLDLEFINIYNTGLYYEALFKIIGKISAGSLYRWQNKLKECNDWTSLVGQYKYSSQKEYNTTLNEEQINIFLKILLSPNNFSIGKSISLTKQILTAKGYEILPKDITFRRYANWFRDTNLDISKFIFPNAN